jgi:hypothetical protein
MIMRNRTAAVSGPSHLWGATGRATDCSGESHFGLQSVALSYSACPVAISNRLIVLAGNLLNEINDAAPELGFVDPHERLAQGKPLASDEEIRHVGGRRCLFHSVG